MRYLLLMVVLGCGDNSTVEEPVTRSLGIQVCYNPSSVWHLSECNANCTLGDYTGTAMCFAISETICQNPDQEHIRRACGLYRGLL